MPPGTVLPTPGSGRDHALDYVDRHLRDVVSGPISGSERFAGGQRAADAALAGFDVAGYAGRRNEVLPIESRGASALSPYIRHGLLHLRIVWDHVAGGPSRDVAKFRDELLWQEYARHWYARLGHRTRTGVRRELHATHDVRTGVVAWDRSMACVDETVTELERDGWLVNQTRMWLASEWAVRRRAHWRDGEDAFFRHLLDGSRAANRLGWQWTTGVGAAKHYSFSRWQVTKRAPELCDRCEHRAACPIEDWPDEPSWTPLEQPTRLRRDDDPARTAGPERVTGSDPRQVWLTAESLGRDDPALAAHPDLPAIFVFDRPLLDRLRLSAQRLVFLVETLAELAEDHDLEIALGDPVEVLSGRRLAATFAPVPGFRRIAAAVQPVEMHPAAWLVRPHAGSISSFSAWRKRLGRIAP